MGITTPEPQLADGLVPVAFTGRTCTLVMQDPAASLRRQVRECQAKLPPGWYIAAYYWDIESGGLAIDQAATAAPTSSSPASASPATADWPTCSPKRPAHRRASPR
jgi:hypothetical protein